MKKIILPLVLLLMVLPLAGCMGMETVTAPDGAIPIADMPLSPEGLVLPIPEGYEIVNMQESESLFTYGERTIYVRYAIAPNAVAVINSAMAQNLREFAEQYIDSDDITPTTFSFMGQNAILITAILDEDDQWHGRAGEAAVHAIAPFGDYFVMVSGYAPGPELDGMREDVMAFLAGFTAGN